MRPLWIGFKCDEPKKQKSQILNFEFKAITTNLIMKVQRLVGENWEDVNIVVEKWVTVPAQGHLALDTIWTDEGYWQASETGTYRVYADLRNSQGDIIKDINGNELVASYEFEVE